MNDEDVKYLLPRGKGGKPASEEPPSAHKLYAFELNDVFDKLDMLFSGFPDPYGTFARFTSRIERDWRIGYGIDIQATVRRAPMRQHVSPQVTTSLLKSGVMITVGAKDKEEALKLYESIVT
ncbi:MAG: hypothetical protein QW231_03760 [Candidatus Bathyarchaeia archaeon]